MKVAINQALTSADCSTAIQLSTQLYNSIYSDNDIRLLYASSHACNVGIQLYGLLDDITKASFTTPDSIIRTFVRLFPTSASDSRLQSAWFSQDGLLASLNTGAVVAPVDQINFTSFNPSSVEVTDRTLDSNTYLMFIGMAVIGTGLNRYGYTAAQSPAGLSYAQGQNLPWGTLAAVKADTSGAACATVAGFYNMFDGINSIVGLLSGSTSSQLSSITTLLSTALDNAGNNQCTTVDPFTQVQCTAAKRRIHFRGACAENDPNASFAAGVINGINALWQ
jgi:hypothetical protein